MSWKKIYEERENEYLQQLYTKKGIEGIENRSQFLSSYLGIAIENKTIISIANNKGEVAVLNFLEDLFIERNDIESPK